MSRHKLVKALDLDEVLDDYDGGLDEDVDEELAPEDREQLRRGTNEVRQTLGADFNISDKEIEDTLYYYYYDVPKTVNYLLNQKANSGSKKSKKKATEGKADGKVQTGLVKRRNRLEIMPLLAPTTSPSTSEFFRDAPWFNIPQDRKADITCMSLCPRGGLLGGSAAGSNSRPKSKLAALAAARKKENRKSQNEEITPSLVSMSESSAAGSTMSHYRRPASIAKSQEAEGLRGTSKAQSNRRPSRDSQGRPTSASPKPAFSEGPEQTAVSQLGDLTIQAAPSGPPSKFASAVLGLEENRPCVSRASASPGIPFIIQDVADSKAFTGPSPDDVVLKAQSSSKGAKPALKKSEKITEEGSDHLNGHLKTLNIGDENPKPKSKSLNVTAEHAKAELKKSANFVVIGHVDAGKSTLMGRLLHDLQSVDQRTIDKYRKESERLGKASFALAWVLDQGTEERERGVTIDIANFQFETEGTKFTILDAPGHQDFVPNMIAGASQADFAVLVIDASTGGFESGLKGQTKEHALLVRSMGVQRVIIAVNKLDAVQWSQDRFDEISQQISSFLTTAGFLAKNLAFVPCSGLAGGNVVHKATDSLASWYTGEPLLRLLEDYEPTERAIERPLRLTIDDVFRGGVQNSLSVSGRLDAGTLQIGESLLIAPVAHTATIKGIEVNAEPFDWAVAGQNVILHLADVDPKHLRPGDVLCSPSSPIQSLKSFAVKLLAFEHIMPMHCEVHRGRTHAPGKIAKLTALLDKGSGARLRGKKPRLIQPGSVAEVFVEMEEAQPLESGNRVILREGGITIGAGLIK